MRITTHDITERDFGLSIDIEDYDTGDTIGYLRLDLVDGKLVIYTDNQTVQIGNPQHAVSQEQNR